MTRPKKKPWSSRILIGKKKILLIWFFFKRVYYPDFLNMSARIDVAIYITIFFFFKKRAPAAGIFHLNQVEVIASGELVSVCCLWKRILSKCFFSPMELQSIFLHCLPNHYASCALMNILCKRSFSNVFRGQLVSTDGSLSSSTYCRLRLKFMQKLQKCAKWFRDQRV